jgi:hypothetical protein
MYTTKSGQKFGSAMVGKKKDAMGAENKEPVQSNPDAGSAEKEEPRTLPTGEAKFSSKEATAPDNDVLANPEGVDAGAVAAEHGPASHVTLHHDHQGGKHVVVSRHPSGHMNMSQHASHAEAHDAAKQLSGVGHDENTDKSPNIDADGDDDSKMFGDSFKTPRLA